jgi:sortase A
MVQIGQHVGVGGRPGSRPITRVAALGVVLAVLSLAGCGSRAELASGALPAPVFTPAPAPPPTLAAPPTSAPPMPALVAEDAAAGEEAVPAPVEVPPGIGVVGRIVIPRIGLDAPLLEGESLDVLAYGPGHRDGSAYPGQLGNVVVAGHRTTRTRPFRHLDTLQPGDALTFETATGVYRYEFAVSQVIDPSQVEITNQPNGYIATLYACHPPGSARNRIVAYFRLVSAPETGQPDPATVDQVPLPLV